MKHLVILHHGLWGNKSHMEPLNLKLQEKYPSDLTIINVDVNEGTHTYDGIDICGDRCVQVIQKELDTGYYDRISFIGYSLGGLILRYVIGRLFSLGVFERVVPVNYISLASPHLGTAKPPVGHGNRLYNALQSTVLTRVGPQFTATDKYLDNLPLIVILSHPDYAFYKALKKFKFLATFANTKADRSVRYTTASMNTTNPYLKYHYKVIDKAYPLIVTFDRETTMQEEAMTSASYLRYVILPIILPLWLVIASIGLTTVAIKASHRQARIARIEWTPKIDEPTNDPDESDDDKLDEGEDEELHPSGTLNKERDSVRLNMIRNLNTLPWKKYDVRIDALNAHAAMVMRPPWGKPEYGGVLDFVVETVFKLE